MHAVLYLFLFATVISSCVQDGKVYTCDDKALAVKYTFLEKKGLISESCEVQSVKYEPPHLKFGPDLKDKSCKSLITEWISKGADCKTVMP